VLYAEFDAERLVTLAKGAKEYQSFTHGKHTIHSWLDESKKNKDGSLPRTYAALHKSRVIFGQRQATVASALDVLDGSAPTLAKNENLPQLGKPAAGVFLQAAARKLDVAENDPNAAVFRLSKLMRLDIGEANQQVSATLTFETKSEEVAKSISSIIQGVLSLVKLQTEKPAAMKLAEAISLKPDAANLVASVTLPVADVTQMLSEVTAKKKEKEKEKDKENK
jgi:hypothetical protein